MDISNIPKFFWYSVSISILIATLGLTTIAYRSANVSLEIANTKINLVSAITDTEQLLSTVRKENERLKITNDDLQEKMKKLQKLTGQPSSPEKSQTIEKSKFYDKELFIIPQKSFDDIEKNLKALKSQVRG